MKTYGTRAAAAFVLALACSLAAGQEGPNPVRHNVAKPGREILVLRSHRLQAGGHEQFYRSSRDDVWPYFEQSRGAFFLQGETAPGGPYFMPPLREKSELVESGRQPVAADPYIPVRVDVAQPGVEIVVIRYQRIQKGSFDRFVELTKSHIWPWEEKLGARPLGQWKVIFPSSPGVTDPSRGDPAHGRERRVRRSDHDGALRQQCAL